MLGTTHHIAWAQKVEALPDKDEVINDEPGEKEGKHEWCKIENPEQCGAQPRNESSLHRLWEALRLEEEEDVNMAKPTRQQNVARQQVTERKRDQRRKANREEIDGCRCVG